MQVVSTNKLSRNHVLVEAPRSGLRLNEVGVDRAHLSRSKKRTTADFFLVCSRHEHQILILSVAARGSMFGRRKACRWTDRWLNGHRHGDGYSQCNIHSNGAKRYRREPARGRLWWQNLCGWAIVRVVLRHRWSTRTAVSRLRNSVQARKRQRRLPGRETLHDDRRWPRRRLSMNYTSVLPNHSSAKWMVRAFSGTCSK